MCANNRVSNANWSYCTSCKAMLWFSVPIITALLVLTTSHEWMDSIDALNDGQQDLKEKWNICLLCCCFFLAAANSLVRISFPPPPSFYRPDLSCQLPHSQHFVRHWHCWLHSHFPSSLHALHSIRQAKSIKILQWGSVCSSSPIDEIILVLKEPITQIKHV